MKHTVLIGLVWTCMLAATHEETIKTIKAQFADIDKAQTLEDEIISGCRPERTYRGYKKINSCQKKS